MLQNSQIIQKLSKVSALCECSQCLNRFVCKDIYNARASKPGHLCDTCKNRISALQHISYKALHELYGYDEVTGEVRHKLDTLRCSKGDLATYNHSEGYLSMAIGGQEYLAHRIIWMMKTGTWPDQVDHNDHDRANNSWSNLSDVSGRENSLNTGLQKNNPSGVTGVRILPSGRYCAYITVHRKQISLGTFDDFNDAVAARLAGQQRYSFHANHGR